MTKLIEAEAHMMIGEREIDVTLYGECFKAVDGGVECRVLGAVSRMHDVTDDEFVANAEAWRTRLVCAFITDGVRGRECVTDGHDGGPDAA